MEAATSLEQKTGMLYNDVTFEAQALYGDNDKQLLTYDASLASLRSRGQIRHPRPQEVFSLLIANLENTLTTKQKSVADDMLNSYGEWLSAAVERHGDTLTVYTDPEGLVWDATSQLYVKQDFKSTDKKEFSIQGIPSAQYVDLNKFGNDFIEFLYTRPFDKLPSVMQQGDKRAQVYLPPDGQIWPVGRGIYISWFSVSCYIYDYGASRGVVPSRAKKSGSAYRNQAITEDERMAARIDEALSQFDKYLGTFGQEQYQQDKQQAKKELLALLKK